MKVTAMSDPSRLRAYRACVNLPEAVNGKVLLIDDSDDRWADRIRSGALVAVGPPVDYEPPVVPYTRDVFGAQPEGSALPDDWAPADPQPANPTTEQDYFEYPIGDQE